MITAPLVELAHNVALLLVMCLVYDVVSVRWRGRSPSFRRVLTGALVGAMGVMVLLTPWEVSPGVFFDARSVLLSTAGLFFGAVPTSIAVVITASFRLHQGGPGAVVGAAVTMLSAALGLVWRRRCRGRLAELSWGELYLLGILVHVAMLLCMLWLPRPVAREVLAHVGVPVLLLFPLGQALLGRLMSNRLRHERLLDTLAQSEARWNKVLSTALDGIVMLDPEGRISLWNDAALRIFGYSAPEALGQDLHSLLSPGRLHGEQSRGLAAFRSSGGGRVVGRVLELTALRKGGEEFPVELSVSAVALEGQWHAVGILRDITERKRAEEQLRQTVCQLEDATARANRLAEEANRANAAKSEFLANVSHEIRTPMNGVIGMTGLLLDTELTAEQRRYAEIVRTSGEALLSLLNDILDFSKIEARKLELEALDFDLRSSLEDTAELLAGRAHEKRLELVCLVEPDVPSLVRGDPGRLRQILVNLVGNAVKFTHAGSIIVRASLQGEAERLVTVRFTVTDTGIGIPADRLGALFEPFVQADGSTTRRYGGSGLGLAISRQLVKKMGGSIGVESDPGRGSSFWFTVVLEKQREERETMPALPAKLSGVRVLVVDDHEANRLLATTLLGGWGCHVAEAADAEGALEVLRQAAERGEPFQTALLDRHMPGIDGEELGLRIKADPTLKATALLLLTSLGQPGDGARLESIGFAGSLPKPLQRTMLFDRLALALGMGPGVSDEPPRGPTRPSPSGARGGRARILVAEDNSTNQQVALAFLKRLGYRADAVADGQEALDALKSIPYDLVLMDCQMPELDGYETTRRIRGGRSGVRDANVPILAMTAHAMKGDRETCLEAGMNGYLAKPLQPEDLAEALAHWLEEPAAGGEVTLRTRPGASGGAKVVFDEVSLLERLSGDRDLAGTVVAVFLEDAPQQLRTLEEFLAAGDRPGACRQLHTLKGAAASVGAERLAAAATREEVACQEGGSTGAAARLRAELQRFEAALESLRHRGTEEGYGNAQRPG